MFDNCEKTDAVASVSVAYTQKIISADGLNGKVLVGDIYWKAKTQNGETIAKDESVKIVSVEGTTLVITK